MQKVGIKTSGSTNEIYIYICLKPPGLITSYAPRGTTCSQWDRRGSAPHEHFGETPPSRRPLSLTSLVATRPCCEWPDQWDFPSQLHFE
jgi:hypothetical protein